MMPREEHLVMTAAEDSVFVSGEPACGISFKAFTI